MDSLVFWGGIGWDDGTIWLYIFTSCLAGFFAFLSSASFSSRKSILPFVLSTIILILFKGLSISGVDVQFGGGYYLNFMSAVSLRSFRDKTVEIGFQVLTVMVRHITDSYEIYLIIVALISVLPVMFVIWQLRDRINLSFAVLGYSLVYLVTGMSAMRQFMAVGICLLATYYYLTNCRQRALLLFLLSLSFHYSSACILLLVVFFLTEKKKSVQLLVAFLSVLFCFIAKSAISGLFTGRYSIYSLNETVDFGAAAFLKYIPIFILLFAVEIRLSTGRLNEKLELNYLSHCWSILIFSFSMALIGYIIPIFGRAESYSLPIVLVIAYLIRKCEEERFFRLPVKVLVFTYFCFRLLLYMSDSYLSEGLMPYLTWL